MAFWMDTGTGTPTDPGTTPVVDAVRQFATEGGAGVPPSVPGAEWFNMMTDEVLAVLAAAGIAPDKAVHDQLAAALSAMFPKKSQFTASILPTGYQKLSSGLIIQWGLSAPIASGVNLPITLPLVFPNGYLHSFTTYNNTLADTSAGTAFIGQIRATSLSSITIRNLGPANAQFSWFSIGH